MSTRPNVSSAVAARGAGLGVVGGVPGQRQAAAAEAADLTRDRLGGVRPQVHDDHVGAGPGERPGARPADGAAASGDERDRAPEVMEGMHARATPA